MPFGTTLVLPAKPNGDNNKNDICQIGWQDWTEETIQANFELIQAM